MGEITNTITQFYVNLKRTKIHYSNQELIWDDRANRENIPAFEIKLSLYCQILGIKLRPC